MILKKKMKVFNSPKTTIVSVSKSERAVSPARPLFTLFTEVLPQDLVKSRNPENQVQTYQIVMKFDRHLGSSAAVMPVKFKSDAIIITSIPVALIL